MTAELPALSPFDELKVLIVTGDSAGVVAFFTGMPEKQRRALVKQVREYLKTLNWRAVDGHRDWAALRERQAREARPLLLAGVATAANAKAVARWMRDIRRQTTADVRPLDPLVKVLADRDPAWLAEVPAAITETLDWFSGTAWELAQAVATLSGVTPVATGRYILAWAGSYTSRERSQDRMRQDPYLDEFLPRLFDEADGDNFLAPWSPFRQALDHLIQEHRVQRGPLLDAVLGRLLRGGRPGEMTNAMTLLDVLEPTDDEYLARISSCISLLSSAAGPVARRFLGIVKGLSDAGVLEVEPAVEAASIVVTRPEKNVVRTALGWLDALVTRHPDRAGEIVPVTAGAFASQASELQERAVKLVAKRARLLGADDRERLVSDGRYILPPDLAGALASGLGVESEDAGVSVAAAFPEAAPYVPRPMPGPITTPAEAAEVFAALIWRGPDDPMTVERFLEAVAEFARSDAGGLREAFQPVIEQNPLHEWQRRQMVLTPRTALLMLAEAVAGTDPRRVPHRTTVATLWGRMHAKDRNRHWSSIVGHNGPMDVLVLRLMELVSAVGIQRMPSLLALPTAANGLIDPAVLAERLRRCEAEERKPLTVDFQQALLRLPHDCGDVDVAGLTSEAGLQFAAWVRGERAELPSVSRAPHKSEYTWSRESGFTLRSSQLPPQTLAQAAGPDVESLFDLVRVVWDAPGWTEERTSWGDCLPAMLPADPDLVAVALAPPLHPWTREETPTVPALLAESDGQRQGALHFVLADRMAGADAPGRAGAVDAALVLASRGLLDGALLAADLVSLLTTTESAGLRKAVPCLRDLANGGAARQVWEAVAGTVAEVLPPKLTKALPGTADLLALGTEIAGSLGVRGPIPAVTDLAARKGSGSVPGAARRLEAVLAGR